MTTNEHTPGRQPSCSSAVALALAVLSAFIGVLSLIASVTIVPHAAWAALLAAIYPSVAAILPGVIAALIPHTSTRTRIVALIGIALGVLNFFLGVSLAGAACQQFSSSCE